MNRSSTLITAAERFNSLPPAARAVFRLMKRLRHGQLRIVQPDGQVLKFGQVDARGLKATICLHNWNVCAAALRRGDIGLAESFIAGDWSTPDLSTLLTLFIANRDEIESVVYGHWWGSLLHRLRHVLRRNSRRGSTRNIHAHYDLGNAFYQLWLDPTLNYSSAWFEGDVGQSLADAQQAKVRRALQQCRVKAGDKVLEIGCGWGALAELAAREFGAPVTGITLSKEQFNAARDRLQAQQLEGDIRLQDYRDFATEAPFDAVVSIEMFEAVGRAYWPQFFSTVRERLKPGGRACIQTITIRDDLFKRYARSTDFIQQYIFPGGFLPSAAAFRSAAQAAGLEVVAELGFGLDYAETLRRWQKRFQAQDKAIRRLGFDTRFIRIWNFYLSYCEAAFTTGNTDVVQFTLQKKS